MRKTILFALLIGSIQCCAQTFKIGVMSTKGTVFKLPNPGTLIITDSIFTTKIMGHEVVKKVANRTSSNIYITDGTATDKVTINPMAARLKGFQYDHAIVIDEDARFNGAQLIYFCQKLPD